MTSDFVPVINVGFDQSTHLAPKLIAADISKACRTSGFFVITGHGVPTSVIDGLHDRLKSFFTQSEARKQTVAAAIDDPLLRGYIPGERHQQFYMNRLGELPPSYTAQAFARLRGPNKWPNVPGMCTAMTAYYRAMERTAARLTRLFALSLDVDPAWFAKRFDQHMSPLVGNYYPAQPTPPPPGSLRNAQHRDWCAFTILHQDTAPGGLQVLDNEENWVDVPPVPGSFVVNLGRIMTQWTSGEWASTVHRVVNPSREFAHRDRISMPFFYHPNPSVYLGALPGRNDPHVLDPETAGHYHIRMADSSRQRKRLPSQTGAHVSSGVPLEFIERRQ